MKRLMILGIFIGALATVPSISWADACQNAKNAKRAGAATQADVDQACNTKPKPAPKPTVKKPAPKPTPKVVVQKKSDPEWDVDFTEVALGVTAALLVALAILFFLFSRKSKKHFDALLVVLREEDILSDDNIKRIEEVAKNI